MPACDRASCVSNGGFYYIFRYEVCAKGGGKSGQHEIAHTCACGVRVCATSRLSFSLALYTSCGPCGVVAISRRRTMQDLYLKKKKKWTDG